MQWCSPAEWRWRKRLAIEDNGGVTGTVHMGVNSDGSDPVRLAVAQSALIQDGSVLIKQGGMTTVIGVLPALPNRAKRVGANIRRKRNRGQDSPSQGWREYVFAVQ